MSSVNLSQLAAPAVVEPLDFETTLAALKADLISRCPDVAEVLTLESEPLTKALETIAYSKINDRARINDAAVAVMLAYATGSDLDHIGANYDTPRLTGETDASFRMRIQQAYHRLAAAGPVNAYKQHTLAVSADIVDVDVFSEQPGQVTVCVLAREQASRDDLSDDQLLIGTALFGTTDKEDTAWNASLANSPLLRAVIAALNAEDVRPLTDAVIVRPPEVQPFAVTAILEILPGPDAELIRTRRLAALNAYLLSVRQIRYDVTRAGIIAALVEAGVKNVRLSSPSADIDCGHGQLAVCTGIRLSTESVDV